MSTINMILKIYFLAICGIIFLALECDFLYCTLYRPAPLKRAGISAALWIVTDAVFFVSVLY